MNITVRENQDGSWGVGEIVAPSTMANDRTTEEIVEPHWPSMFAMAKRIVDQQVEQDYGRDFVLEMLDFGKRMAEEKERNR